MSDDLIDVLHELGEALGELSDAGEEVLVVQLARLLTEVAAEAKARPAFARRLGAALAASSGSAGAEERRRRPHRRAPGVLDPFEVFRQGGETDLRARLTSLSVEELKDIVAEHGMDRDKLAMKWKAPDRLIDRIASTVMARAAKGDVFMR